MSSSKINLNLEPCSECPIPMNVIVNDLTKKTDQCLRFGIEGREGGEQWTEEIYE